MLLGPVPEFLDNAAVVATVPARKSFATHGENNNKHKTHERTDHGSGRVTDNKDTNRCLFAVRATDTGYHETTVHLPDFPCNAPGIFKVQAEVAPHLQTCLARA